MQVFRFIREKMGLNQWKMHKKLGLPSIQSYQYLESRSKTTKIENLIKLRAISKMDIAEFWKMVENQLSKKREEVIGQL